MKQGRPKGTLSLRSGTRSVRRTTSNNGQPAVSVVVGVLGIVVGDEVVVEYFDDLIIIRRDEASPQSPQLRAGAFSGADMSETKNDEQNADKREPEQEEEPHECDVRSGVCRHCGCVMGAADD